MPDMKPLGSPRRALLVVLFLALTCVERADAQRPQHVNLDTLPRLVAREERRIGSHDDPDVGFSRVGSVAVDRDGNLYVFESVDLQIRVYDPAGRELRRIGGRGGGPGEFRGLTTIGLIGDTIWAVEPNGNRRLTLFNRQGRMLSTAPVGLASVPVSARYRATLAPLYMSAAGVLVSDITSLAGSSDGPAYDVRTDTVLVPRVRFNLQATVLDTAGWIPRYPWGPSLPTQPRTTEVVHVNGERYRRPVPPLDKKLAVPFAEGHFLVDRDAPRDARRGTFYVTRVALGGDTVYRRGFNYRPVGYNSAFLDSIAASAARVRVTGTGASQVGVIRPPGADSAQVRKALRAAVDFPRAQPPVQEHWVGNDGALWLRREDKGGATKDWLLLAPDGSSPGTVELKRRLHPMWSHGDILWAVDPDEFDVPWLVRYRISSRR